MNPFSLSQSILPTRRLAAVATLSAALLVAASVQAQEPAQPLDDAKTLDAITVVGKVVRGEERRHEDNVATKSSLPIAQTPQAVAVITREQLDAQAVTRVSEALRYSAGVMPESDGMDARFDSWAVRGFYSGSTTWLDGIRLDGGSGAGNNWTLPQTEPFFLERIDILKGPSSVTYGQVVPGGAVMLASKRPAYQSEGLLQLRLFSPAGWEVAGDVQGVTASGNSGWRVAAVSSTRDTMVDGVERRRSAIAPSLALRLGDRGDLLLMAQAQRDRGGSDYQWLPAYGTLFPNPNGIIPPSNFIGDHAFDRFDRDQASAGWKLHLQLSDRLELEQNLKYSSVETTTDMIQNDMFGDDDPAVSGDWDWRSVRRYVSHGVGESRGLGADTRLRYRIDGEHGSQEWLAGIDYYRNHFSGQRDAADVVNDLYHVDVYAPQPGVDLSAFSRLSAIDSRKSQVGMYLQNQIIAGDWRILAGLRRDRAQTDERSTRGDRPMVRTEETQSATTGRLGVLYLLENGLAPYASFSTSFEPVGGSTAEGVPFRPMTARQKELGVKYAPQDQRWYVTAAAFDVVQRNRLTDDPVNGYPDQVQTGEVRVKGWELELKLLPWKGWSVDGTYARLSSEVTQSEIPEELGRPLTFLPRERAALWVTHDWRTWRAALGARYTGESYGSDIGLDPGYASLRIPGYILFDGQLQWTLPATALGVTALALNVSNIADKRYVTGCGGVWTCGYGYGRQYTLTLTQRW